MRTRNLFLGVLATAALFLTAQPAAAVLWCTDCSPGRCCDPCYRGSGAWGMCPIFDCTPQECLGTLPATAVGAEPAIEDGAALDAIFAGEAASCDAPDTGGAAPRAVGVP